MHTCKITLKLFIVWLKKRHQSGQTEAIFEDISGDGISLCGEFDIVFRWAIVYYLNAMHYLNIPRVAGDSEHFFSSRWCYLTLFLNNQMSYKEK